MSSRDGSTYINIRQLCGNKVATRRDGRVLHEALVEALKGGHRITLDFEDMLIASVSFMDEAFGRLALRYSLDRLKRDLSIQNIQEFDRALLNDIIISRSRQRRAKSGKAA